MFNGYNETPSLISFNDFDQDKEKKQENASKWSYGYDAGGPPAQTPGHSHQPELWSPKSNFLGNAPAGNAPSKCNCSGCYSADHQSYQNVSTRHRPWLPRTFPVPLSGSSETCKLPDYHQLDGVNLTNQGSYFPDSNGVASPYYQESNGKHPHYRHYQISRLPESNQPGVISSSVNSEFAKKELFQSQKEEIPSNIIGQDLSFLRQNGTRQPVYCNTTYGIIRNVETRLNNRNRGSNICDSLEKYSNVDLYRHPSSTAPYPLDQHINRPSVVEPYIKAVPSNLNQNRVPSIGHRNSKENMSQPYIDKVYNDSKKNISSDTFQMFNGEKKSGLPATFQPPLVKEGATSDNYQTAPLHGFPSPVALNLKNNGVPIDCTYFNINRDFSKSCGNLSEAETQKLLYMSDRYPDYFSKSNLPDVIKRNNQSHLLDGKKESAINQINQKNYYEQQPNNLHRSNIITNATEYLESSNAKAPFGAFYSKELESTKVTKSEMFDMLHDNPAIFQRKEEVIKNENVNVHPRLPRPAPVFNDPRALCPPAKPQNCFSSPNGAAVPFGNFINSDYSYQGHHMQGHHTYSYPHSSVPLQRNDLNQYNHANLYQQISHGNSQSLSMHSNSAIIFNPQAQSLTNSEIAPQQFCAVKSHNVESKSSTPQSETTRLCSPLEIKKPNYLETLRSEDINKNGSSKISPLRLLRKKKFTNQVNEVSSETTPPSANTSDSGATLDVRKFWSTWAEEEEESVATAQVVVLDCQNIGVEEARLLHLYENEPVRALHLENGNLVTFREPDCDKILSDNVNQCESRVQSEQIEIGNEIKNGREEISKPVNASQETVVEAEEIIPVSKSFSENCQTEKVPGVLEDKTKITGAEPTATQLVTDELIANKESLSAKSETRSNFPQENVEGAQNNNFSAGKKSDDEVLKLDKWTEKKFDFLKRAEESKAAEILRNSEEKKRIFERRYSFQHNNFHQKKKKVSSEVSTLSDSEITPTTTDYLERKNSFSESAVVEVHKAEDQGKNFSSHEVSQELSQNHDKGKFLDLPTSEYRRNKFLNYSGKRIALHNDHSNALVNEKSMTNGGNIRNYHDAGKPTVNSSNIANENIPKSGVDNIKKEEESKMEESNNDWSFKNKETVELDEKKFRSENETAITFASLKEETGTHNFEMDDILHKMSNINFHGSEIKVDSCLGNGEESHEVKPVKVKKLKTLAAGKKLKKSKKLIREEDEDLENGETRENLALSKPTIKFSIQKLHDLKISLKVLNGGKKYEKCAKDDDDDEIWEKKMERTDNSGQSSNSAATELITLKLKSIQRDDKTCDVSKFADQKRILKKKKKRFKRRKVGEESSATSIVRSHRNKNKKSKHGVREENDPLAQDSNNEILLSVIEKHSDKYSSSDDFQVQETVDSAKIKLTFKRHKPSSFNPSPIQNDGSDRESQSICISRSSGAVVNPLCVEKSILKFDSPPGKDLQFIKSEENWFDEFSESYNHLDGVSEESQTDCNSTSSPNNHISSPYCNNNCYSGDVFIESEISPKSNSHGFTNIEDQCDSQDFENVEESSERKIAKIENEIFNGSNEDGNMSYYSLLNEDDYDDGDIDDDKGTNKRSPSVSIDKGESEMSIDEVESLQNNILNYDEDSYQTDICDESFMDCGPDIATENEDFQEVDGRELQVTDPLTSDPVVKADDKDKDDCTNSAEIEKRLDEEIIKYSVSDREEEICEELKIPNSQSSLIEKKNMDSENFSREEDPFQDDVELINCDVKRAETVKDTNLENVMGNIEKLSESDKPEISDYSTNHLKHSEKINGSYEFKSDIKQNLCEEVNFSNYEVEKSPSVEEESKENVSKEIILESADEVAEEENVSVELPTSKDNGQSIISSVPEISHSKEICETNETNGTEDEIHSSCEESDNERAHLHNTKETVVTVTLNKKNCDNFNGENVEKNEAATLCEKNGSKAIPAKLELKIKEQKNAEPGMQNAANWASDFEKDSATSQSPECEKQFLDDRIDLHPTTHKNSSNNNSIYSQCDLSEEENVIKSRHSFISSNVICSNSNKNKATSENIQILNSSPKGETQSNESNDLKLVAIKATAEIELIREELQGSEETIKCNGSYESNQMDHAADKGQMNEHDEGIVKEFKESNKTEIKHTSSPEFLNARQTVMADKDHKKEKKSRRFSKSNNWDVCEKTELFAVLKELTCGKSRKIKRRHSLTQKIHFENRRSTNDGSQKLKNSQIIPLFENILKNKSLYGKCKRRREKAKSCPPLEFSYPVMAPAERVATFELNIPVEDIPLPPGDPPPENCFDFVEYFKRRKLQNTIKPNDNSSEQTDSNRLEVNGHVDGCLPVDSKVNEVASEENQNHPPQSQKEISPALDSPGNCEPTFRFCDLQNCRNPSPPLKTENENNSGDQKPTNSSFSNCETGNCIFISADKIDLEEVKDKTEKNGTPYEEKIISPPSSANKIYDENKAGDFESTKSVELVQVVDQKICPEEMLSDSKSKNQSVVLEDIKLPEKLEVKERKKKSRRKAMEETAIKAKGINESRISKDGEDAEVVPPAEKFDKNSIENQVEIVSDDFEIDENGKEDVTVVADEEQKTILEIQNKKSREDEFYECEDIPTSEDLPNDDDMAVEKVSDDDRFRHVMQNCLDNAKKFFNVSNLKLFSCSVEDLLEMDCQFTDVAIEDGGEPEKSGADPVNHISKDVLLTSCDNDVNDDLILSEKFQLHDLSVDFVPSFNAEGPHNLCPEILPVDNWPYLEEEVPSSPTKCRTEETDLMPPLENDGVGFEKSWEEQEFSTYRNHAAFYAKNKLNKIREGFDKLVNCNIVSLPEISHVDFKRFRRRSLLSDSERVRTNSKIGCQRRRTIDCLAGNKLAYSAFNKDMQHFKTEVAKLKSGLEKIEHLWRKSKNLKCSTNIEKIEEGESKDGKSIKKIQSCFGNECRVQCFRAEAKNVKDAFKQDKFGVVKSSEAVLQREKNNFYFKSPTWQPKVLLFRISKKELNKMNKSSLPYVTSKENNCKRISKENYNKLHKDSRHAIQIDDLIHESTRRTSKEQISELHVHKDIVINNTHVKERKSDKVKVYVKTDAKDSGEETEKLNGQHCKTDNFKPKAEQHDSFSSPFDNGFSQRKEKHAKHCDTYSFAFSTDKELERSRTAELVLVENQIAPVKRKKSRFRNLHSKRKKSSHSDADTKINVKQKLLPENPTLVETERVLSELFKESGVSRDLSVKNKIKSTKDDVNIDRIKDDVGVEKRKNRHVDVNDSDFQEKRAKKNEHSGSHLKNNSGDHYRKRSISSSSERNAENSKHEIVPPSFTNEKKSSEEILRHGKSDSHSSQTRESEKSKSKHRSAEKHRESIEGRESRHASDHRSKKRQSWEREEKQELLKLKNLAHSQKKNLPIKEDSHRKSKSRESSKSVSSKGSDSKSEKRVKIEEEDMEDPWMCEVCGFNDAKERVTHIKSHPFHCQSCHLAFNTEAHFTSHLTKMHKDIKNQHHCLLCELSFDTENEYQKHLETREHRHLESVEKNTINTLFTLLTGHPCPALGLVEMKPEWLPNQAGMVHFYHQATPLSLALQYLKMHHDLTSFPTISSVDSS